MKISEYNKYVNKRILWMDDSEVMAYGFSVDHIDKETFENPKDGVVNEISPSKKYVNINKKWYNIKGVHVIEVLKDK